jgi:hypothetical protein
MVAQARAAYATIDAERAAALAGVSDAIADYRRTPDDWTIKEILAHQIAVEYDFHTWLVGMIEDGPAEPLFHNNIPQRMRALVAAYPTLADLEQEIQRAEAVNIAMIATLPPEMIRRKHQVALLALYLPGAIEHGREHFPEIQALAQAAGAPA